MAKNALFRFPGFSFEDLFQDFQPEVPTGFPHFDLVKHSDGTHVLEVAVAGFDKTALEVTMENDQLTIKGSKVESSEDEDNDVQYLHRGIARRAFTKSFRLGEYFKVASATLDNGILRVLIEKEIPEEKKPKLIPVI